MFLNITAISENKFHAQLSVHRARPWDNILFHAQISEM